MIRSLIAHVRGWSFLVKFVVILMAIFFVTDLVTGRDFPYAFKNVLFGVTMIAVGQYFAPAVVDTLFSHLHDRAGVHAPCGIPAPPTATEWHRAIVGMVAGYTFVVVSLALMGDSFSLMPVLWSGVAFMAPSVGLILLVGMIMEAAHFLGHYRLHRRELIARQRAREQARRDREVQVTDQAFWEMVHGHKPDPGSVA